MDPVMEKGVGIKGQIDYIRKQFGEEGWAKINNRLPAEAQRECSALLATKFYPIELSDQIMRIFAETCLGNDRLKISRSIREMGKFVAEENLNTVYRILMKFLKPKNFIKELPGITEKYFSGVGTEVSQDADAGEGTFIVSGLTLHFASPLAHGWIELGLAKVGAKSVSISEKSWEEGKDLSPRLFFTIKWQA